MSDFCNSPVCVHMNKRFRFQQWSKPARETVCICARADCLRLSEYKSACVHAYVLVCLPIPPSLEDHWSIYLITCEPSCFRDANDKRAAFQAGVRQDEFLQVPEGRGPVRHHGGGGWHGVQPAQIPTLRQIQPLLPGSVLLAPGFRCDACYCFWTIGKQCLQPYANRPLQGHEEETPPLTRHSCPLSAMSRCILPLTRSAA